MNQYIDNNKISLEREIDLDEILYILTKNKKLLGAIAIISAVFSFIFSSYQEKIYRGRFRILIDSSITGFRNSSAVSDLLGVGNSLIGKSSSSYGEENIETKIEIIKGPIVLNSVYEFVKNQQNTPSLSFKDWLINLEVEQVPDTTILEVIYNGTNKSQILQVLERISIAYQDYSLQKKTRSINASYEFLSAQYEKAKNKAKLSSEKLNSFAIKNGLGNFDGIPLLSRGKTNSKNLEESSSASSPFDSNIRYYELFQALQGLETEYTRLSSLLKKDSSVLQNLESQIDKFKTSLERPNEILIEFNDLVRESLSDFKVVESLDAQLRAAELEKVRQQDPWEILTNPLLDKKTVNWSAKKSSAFGFIFGSALGVVLILMKSLFSGIIYTKNSFRRSLPYKYLFSLNFQTKDLNYESYKPAFDLISNNQKKFKVGFFLLTSKFEYRANLFKNLLNSNLKNNNFICSDNILELNGCERLYLLTFRDSISTKELESKIELLEFQDFEIEGWIFVQ